MVPIIVNDNVVAVLDIDSPKHARFTPEVQQEMEAVVNMLKKRGKMKHRPALLCWPV